MVIVATSDQLLQNNEYIIGTLGDTNPIQMMDSHLKHSQKTSFASSNFEQVGLKSKAVN